MKVKEAYSYLLEKLSQIEDPYFAKREAKEILAHLLNLSPLEIYLHPEKEVSKEELDRILKERLTLKPLPYILKRVYFFGRAFYLEEGVLIPRQESEILVEVILNIIKEKRLKEATLLELGCGSGVLSITLLLEEKSLKIFANDISEIALKVTMENAKMHNVIERLKLLKGNFLSPFKKRPLFYIIFSNPPYISYKEWEALDPEVKLFEPKEALISGIRGTEFQEILIREANFYLKKGGFLIFEMGYNQSQRISELAKAFNWKYQFFKDLLGYERVALLWKENM